MADLGKKQKLKTSNKSAIEKKLGNLDKAHSSEDES